MIHALSTNLTTKTLVHLQISVAQVYKPYSSQRQLCFILMSEYPQSERQNPAPSSRSALLDCLERLDEAAWAEVLLDKLLAAGTAGNLAATCTRLRQLVQSCVGKLNLSQLLNDRDGPPEVAAAQAAGLPGHFTAVRSVVLHFTSDNSYVVAQALIPALAR